MAKRKTWTQKLNDDKDLPRVERISNKMSRRWGRGTVVIPAPREVDDLMRNVPEGKVVTINEIRSALARKHSATIGCPFTTGIFAWVAANAAEESRYMGDRVVTPYWRTLKSGGVINDKYPGGTEGQKRLLESEGHIVTKRGKNCIVIGYEKALAQL